MLPEGYFYPLTTKNLPFELRLSSSCFEGESRNELSKGVTASPHHDSPFVGRLRGAASNLYSGDGVSLPPSYPRQFSSDCRHDRRSLQHHSAISLWRRESHFKWRSQLKVGRQGAVGEAARGARPDAIGQRLLLRGWIWSEHEIGGRK